MKRTLTCLVLLFVTVSPATYAQSKFSKTYKPSSVLYVSSVAGMSLRAKPSPQGEVLAVVKFGDQVLVLADVKPPVTFVSTGVSGVWAKVKAGDKEGYMFDGFLSRFPPMPVSQGYAIDLQTYLRQQFKVKSETEKPPTSQEYNDYLKISFDNGVDYLLNAPVGGTSINTSFPVSLFTFQEVFLLARLAYPQFFTSNNCVYQEDNMMCDHESEGSLTIKKIDNAFVINYGRAD